MSVKQPKYTFGDAFRVPMQTEANGLMFKQDFNGYVCAIEAEATDSGFVYKYQLRSSFPDAYQKGTYLGVFYDKKLDTLERAN